MEQCWTANIDVGIDPEELGRHLLAIIGPSGSGKTAIASSMEILYADTFVVPIYTTRDPRDDDVYAHYRYVDDDAFSQLEARREFFICRKEPYPRYGWTRRDLIDGICRRSLAILPFRYGGARFLLESSLVIMAVFIEPLLQASSLYASDRIKAAQENDVLAAIQLNRKLRDLANGKRWPTRTVTNRFLGVDEVHEHAATIYNWAKTFR